MRMRMRQKKENPLFQRCFGREAERATTMALDDRVLDTTGMTDMLQDEREIATEADWLVKIKAVWCLK